MVDIQRLVREGLKLFNMYQRYSKSSGSGGGSQRPAQPGRGGRSRQGTTSSRGRSAAYPGDWIGPVTPQYDPHPDGRPDPGEIVWTWVPYQEDHSQGKDRPVLIVAREGEQLLCVMLTSKDHDTAVHDDPRYVEVGTGQWDRSGRPSEARTDRVIPVRPEDVRREGAVLDRSRFDAVAQALRSQH